MRRADYGYCLTVLVYDVALDRRREKLYALLKEYGVPVQKSAFEARLTIWERRRLLERATAILDPNEDRFVIYVIPGDREASIVSLGLPRPEVKVPRFFIV